MNIQVKINQNRGNVQLVEIDSTNAQVVTIKQLNTKVTYELIDKETGKGPKRIWAERKGNNLEIRFEESGDVDLIIEDYYANDELSPVLGKNAYGAERAYIAESGIEQEALAIFKEGTLTPQVLAEEVIVPFVMPQWGWWLSGLVGISGVAIAASSGSGKTSPIVIPEPTLEKGENGSVKLTPPNVPVGSTITVKTADGKEVVLEKQPDGSWTSGNSDLVPHIPAPTAENPTPSALISGAIIPPGTELTATTTTSQGSSQPATQLPDAYLPAADLEALPGGGAKVTPDTTAFEGTKLTVETEDGKKAVLTKQADGSWTSDDPTFVPNVPAPTAENPTPSVEVHGSDIPPNTQLTSTTSNDEVSANPVSVDTDTYLPPPDLSSPNGSGLNLNLPVFNSFIQSGDFVRFSFRVATAEGAKDAVIDYTLGTNEQGENVWTASLKDANNPTQPSTDEALKDALKDLLFADIAGGAIPLTLPAATEITTEPSVVVPANIALDGSEAEAQTFRGNLASTKANVELDLNPATTDPTEQDPLAKTTAKDNLDGSVEVVVPNADSSKAGDKAVVTFLKPKADGTGSEEMTVTLTTDGEGNWISDNPELVPSIISPNNSTVISPENVVDDSFVNVETQRPQTAQSETGNGVTAKEPDPSTIDPTNPVTDPTPKVAVEAKEDGSVTATFPKASDSKAEDKLTITVTVPTENGAVEVPVVYTRTTDENGKPTGWKLDNNPLANGKTPTELLGEDVLPATFSDAETSQPVINVPANKVLDGSEITAVTTRKGVDAEPVTAQTPADPKTTDSTAQDPIAKPQVAAKENGDVTVAFPNKAESKAGDKVEITLDVPKADGTGSVPVTLTYTLDDQGNWNLAPQADNEPKVNVPETVKAEPTASIVIPAQNVVDGTDVSAKTVRGEQTVDAEPATAAEPKILTQINADPIPKAAIEAKDDGSVTATFPKASDSKEGDKVTVTVTVPTENGAVEVPVVYTRTADGWELDNSPLANGKTPTELLGEDVVPASFNDEETSQPVITVPANKVLDGSEVTAVTTRKDVDAEPVTAQTPADPNTTEKDPLAKPVVTADQENGDVSVQFPSKAESKVGDKVEVTVTVPKADGTGSEETKVVYELDGNGQWTPKDPIPSELADTLKPISAEEPVFTIPANKVVDGTPVTAQTIRGEGENEARSELPNDAEQVKAAAPKGASEANSDPVPKATVTANPDGSVAVKLPSGTDSKEDDVVNVSVRVPTKDGVQDVVLTYRNTENGWVLDDEPLTTVNDLNGKKPSEIFGIDPKATDFTLPADRVLDGSDVVATTERFGLPDAVNSEKAQDGTEKLDPLPIPKASAERDGDVNVTFPTAAESKAGDKVEISLTVPKTDGTGSEPVKLTYTLGQDGNWTLVQEPVLPAVSSAPKTIPASNPEAPNKAPFISIKDEEVVDGTDVTTNLIRNGKSSEAGSATAGEGTNDPVPKATLTANEDGTVDIKLPSETDSKLNDTVSINVVVPTPEGAKSVPVKYVRTEDGWKLDDSPIEALGGKKPSDFLDSEGQTVLTPTLPLDNPVIHLPANKVLDNSNVVSVTTERGDRNSDPVEVVAKEPKEQTADNRDPLTVPKLKAENDGSVTAQFPAKAESKAGDKVEVSLNVPKADGTGSVPVKLTYTLDEQGNWNLAPQGENEPKVNVPASLKAEPTPSIEIPADKVVDNSPVTAQTVRGEQTSDLPAEGKAGAGRIYAAEPAADTENPLHDPVPTANFTQADGAVTATLPSNTDSKTGDKVTLNVTVPTENGAKEVPVTYTRQADGSWNLDDASQANADIINAGGDTENPAIPATLPANNPAVTIPANKVLDGSEVTATTERNNKPSTSTSGDVGAPSNPTAETQDPIAKPEAKAQENGDVTVEFPSKAESKPGDKVEVTVTVPKADGTGSEETKVVYELDDKGQWNPKAPIPSELAETLEPISADAPVFTIPAEKVVDGTAVSAKTVRGDQTAATSPAAEALASSDPAKADPIPKAAIDAKADGSVTATLPKESDSKVGDKVTVNVTVPTENGAVVVPVVYHRTATGWELDDTALTNGQKPSQLLGKTAVPETLPLTTDNGEQPSITVPANKVLDGSTISATTERGGNSSAPVSDTAQTPASQTADNRDPIAKPDITAKENGDVTVDFPSKAESKDGDKVIVNLTVPNADGSGSVPVTATYTLKDGVWELAQSPAEPSASLPTTITATNDEAPELTIPANKVVDGTTVSAQTVRGDQTVAATPEEAKTPNALTEANSDPAPKATLTPNTDGSVTATLPTETDSKVGDKVTLTVQVPTADGAKETPVTYNRTANGWELDPNSADAAALINSGKDKDAKDPIPTALPLNNPTVTVPANKVLDGSDVGVQTTRPLQGDKALSTPETTAKANEPTTETEANRDPIAKPEVEAKANGDVTVEFPSKAESKPGDQVEVTVTVPKADGTGSQTVKAVYTLNDEGVWEPTVVPTILKGTLEPISADKPVLTIPADKVVDDTPVTAQTVRGTGDDAQKTAIPAADDQVKALAPTDPAKADPVPKATISTEDGAVKVALPSATDSKENDKLTLTVKVPTADGVKDVPITYTRQKDGSWALDDSPVPALGNAKPTTLIPSLPEKLTGENPEFTLPAESVLDGSTVSATTTRGDQAPAVSNTVTAEPSATNKDPLTVPKLVAESNGDITATFPSKEESKAGDKVEVNLTVPNENGSGSVPVKATYTRDEAGNWTLDPLPEGTPATGLPAKVDAQTNDKARPSIVIPAEKVVDGTTVTAQLVRGEDHKSPLPAGNEAGSGKVTAPTPAEGTDPEKADPVPTAKFTQENGAVTATLPSTTDSKEGDKVTLTVTMPTENGAKEVPVTYTRQADGSWKLDDESKANADLINKGGDAKNPAIPATLTADNPSVTIPADKVLDGSQVQASTQRGTLPANKVASEEVAEPNPLTEQNRDPIAKPKVAAQDNGNVDVQFPSAAESKEGDQVKVTAIVPKADGSGSEPVEVIYTRQGDKWVPNPASSLLGNLEPIAATNPVLTIPADKVVDGTDVNAETIRGEQTAAATPATASAPTADTENPKHDPIPTAIPTAQDNGDVNVKFPSSTDSKPNDEVTVKAKVPTKDGVQDVELTYVRDENGWTLKPTDAAEAALLNAPSKLPLTQDGTNPSFTIPSENVLDGSKVETSTQRGGVESPTVASEPAKVNDTQGNGDPLVTPEVKGNADGTVSVDFPAAESSKNGDVVRVTVPVAKADGSGVENATVDYVYNKETDTWTPKQPINSALSDLPEVTGNTLTVPAKLVADGKPVMAQTIRNAGGDNEYKSETPTEGNGQATAQKPAEPTADNSDPLVKPTIGNGDQAADKGSVAVGLPANAITGDTVEVDFTKPDGTPEKVTLTKGENGWTSDKPDYQDRVTGDTFTLKGSDVNDGASVDATAKRGETATPADNNDTYTAPVGNDPLVAPTPTQGENGAVSVALPTAAEDKAGDKAIISYTDPAGNKQNIELVSDGEGKWTPKEGTTLPTGVTVVDGKLQIPANAIQDGSPVNVASVRDGYAPVEGNGNTETFNPADNNFTGNKPNQPETPFTAGKGGDPFSAPTVAPNTDPTKKGAVDVTLPTDGKMGDQVEVKFTQPDGTETTALLTRGENGWTQDAPATPALEISGNKATVPANAVKDGTEVTAKSLRDGYDAIESPAPATAENGGDPIFAPTIANGEAAGSAKVGLPENAYAGDTATVSYTKPNGDKGEITLTSDGNGTWTASPALPQGTTLTGNSLVLPDSEIKDNTPVTVTAQRTTDSQATPATPSEYKAPIVDSNNNGKSDELDRDEAQAKIDALATAKRNLEAEIEKAGDAVNPAEKAEIDRLKGLYDAAKREAETAIEAVPPADRDTYRNNDAMNEPSIPAMNDSNSNGTPDPQDEENYQAAKEALDRAKEELNQAIANLDPAVSEDDIASLQDKIVAFNNAKAEAKRLAGQLPENSDATVAEVEAITANPVPEVNDTDRNNVPDNIDDLMRAVEQKNTALANEIQAKGQAYNAEEVATLTQAGRERDEAKEAAIRAIENSNLPEDQKQALKDQVNANNPAVPAVNDLNDNGKPDQDDIDLANAKLADLAEKKAALQQAINNAGSAISAADLADINEKKAAYDAAKPAAQEALDSVPTEKRSEVTNQDALQGIESIPDAVNDTDGNGKVDSTEPAVAPSIAENSSDGAMNITLPTLAEKVSVTVKRMETQLKSGSTTEYEVVEKDVVMTLVKSNGNWAVEGDNPVGVTVSGNVATVPGSKVIDGKPVKAQTLTFSGRDVTSEQLISTKIPDVTNDPILVPTNVTATGKQGASGNVDTQGQYTLTLPASDANGLTADKLLITYTDEFKAHQYYGNETDTNVGQTQTILLTKGNNGDWVVDGNLPNGVTYENKVLTFEPNAIKGNEPVTIKAFSDIAEGSLSIAGDSSATIDLPYSKNGVYTPEIKVDIAARGGFAINGGEPDGVTYMGQPYNKTFTVDQNYYAQSTFFVSYGDGNDKVILKFVRSSSLDSMNPGDIGFGAPFNIRNVPESEQWESAWYVARVRETDTGFMRGNYTKIENLANNSSIRNSILSDFKSSNNQIYFPSYLIPTGTKVTVWSTNGTGKSLLQSETTVPSNQKNASTTKREHTMSYSQTGTAPTLDSLGIPAIIGDGIPMNTAGFDIRDTAPVSGGLVPEEVVAAPIDDIAEDRSATVESNAHTVENAEQNNDVVLSNLVDEFNTPTLINLGAGDDRLTWNLDIDTVTVNGGEGTDTVVITGERSVNANAFSNIEIIDMLEDSGSQTLVLSYADLTQNNGTIELGNQQLDNALVVKGNANDTVNLDATLQALPRTTVEYQGQQYDRITTTDGYNVLIQTGVEII